MAKITKMKDRVEVVMGLHLETRGSDKLLIWRIWAEDFEDAFGYVAETIPLTIHIMKHLSSPETIRRARQLIQAEGKYLPPKDIQRKRIKQEAGVRREVRQKDTDNYYRQTSTTNLF